MEAIDNLIDSLLTFLRNIQTEENRFLLIIGGSIGAIVIGSVIFYTRRKKVSKKDIPPVSEPIPSDIRSYLTPDETIERSGSL